MNFPADFFSFPYLLLSFVVEVEVTREKDEAKRPNAQSPITKILANLIKVNLLALPKNLGMEEFEEEADGEKNTEENEESQKALKAFFLLRISFLAQGLDFAVE